MHVKPIVKSMMLLTIEQIAKKILSQTANHKDFAEATNIVNELLDKQANHKMGSLKNILEAQGGKTTI